MEIVEIGQQHAEMRRIKPPRAAALKLAEMQPVSQMNLHEIAMDGQADEFCLVEPLAPMHNDTFQETGISQHVDGIEFEHTPSNAPGTPVPRPPGTPIPNVDVKGENGAMAVPSVLTDDELWGPPAGARRPYEARGAAAAAAAAAVRTVSPPWGRQDGFAGGRGGIMGALSGGGTASDDEEEEEDLGAQPRGSVDGAANSPRPTRRRVGGGSSGATNAGTSTPPPRRKRTSGINRERQFGGVGSASRLTGGGSGRRRGGPANGKGGLSKKTLSIVTNLRSHTTGVRSREEIEELEEEKRLAEEERRFKENLRQKGDDFEHTIRILLLGDSGVGKTSLMTRFSEDKFAPTMISTAGVDFKVQILEIHGKRIKCQIWDTAGQEKFHVITRAYYRGAHGIALTYDITDSDSFKNVNYWMANIQTHAEHGQRIQKMILGNKIDIEDRAICSKEGQDVAKEFGVRFFEVSAKNGHGVSDAFYTLAVDIVQAMETANRRVDEERRVGRMFGNGAARLRSLASRKPAFLTSRKGAGAGGSGVWSGRGVPGRAAGGGGRAAARAEQQDGSELGDGDAKSASERCKVS